MTTGNQPLIVMQSNCNSAVQLVSATLKIAGYQVQQSFDLHSAMAAHDGCYCNPESCTCQMVVLLVYAQEGSPVTLIFDDDGFQTSIYLVNSLQSSRPSWVGKLAQLLPDTFSTVTSMTSSGK